MNAFKPGRPDWVPKAIALAGLLLAALAVALWVLYLQGVRFR
ncbi:hypothetical protein [Leifsonia sp. 71-9]|nr:hypothetical protein [Leifsonia sp. 71-9]